MHVHQGLRLRGQFAKAVDQFFEQGVDLIAGFGGGQLFVKAQAQVHVAAVVVGQQGGGVQVDVGGGGERVEQVRLFARFEAAHRFGQHFVVELKAHFEHVAALVFAQHLARAADLQVVHGQIKAAAQFLHLLDGVQPLGRLFGQSLDLGHHQIRIGLVVRAAHASAQLVQLGQAELVGPADHDGVGRGHVDAGLDDG